MFPRRLTPLVKKSLKKYRAVALLGPRQSGKTTLAKMCAPQYAYLSLENPDHRLRATEDPRHFLQSCRGSTILDEIQHVPALFSYLQEILDNKKDKRRFILTGSSSFLLSEKIAQSLAGRIRIYYVLPLHLSELPKRKRPKTLDEQMLTGLFPRIYDEGLSPVEWFSDYYQTYIQKDVKSILNISNENLFDRFIRLCAGRVAGLGEYASIANEAGISQPTALRWASVLESSFIAFRLSPYFKNFNKRIIKSPKLYFYDTGLLCRLLRIQDAEMLATHPLRGQIFENFIISEMKKDFLSRGQEAPLYFWRDQHGHEIDALLDMGNHLQCIEIKSGSTFQTQWLKNLLWFSKLDGNAKLGLIYGGEQNFVHSQIPIHSWKELYKWDKASLAS